jgi:hypothetical protein
MPITHEGYVKPKKEANASKPPIGYGLVLMGFSIICFATAFVFSFDDGKPLTIQAPAEGNPVGYPFNVPEDHSVYRRRRVAGFGKRL